MNGIGATYFSRRNNSGDMKVTFFAFCWSYTNTFISKFCVQTMRISLGVDGNTFDTKLTTSADNSNRNFASVSNKNFFHVYLLTLFSVYLAGATIKSGVPNSTGFALSTRIATISPSISDSISFMSFIASTMQSD